MPKKAQKIFISHSQASARDIPQILERLKRRGVLAETDEIVSPEDVHHGHRELRQAVHKQIASSSKVVVIWDKASAQSQWVNYEIGLADALGKQIVPIRLRGEQGPLPDVLRKFQVLELEDDG